MKLAQIQNRFEDHITRADQGIDRDFADLYETGNITLDQRFRVYRDNVIIGLTNMLMGVYPTLEALTGKEFTHSLLHAYVRRGLPKEGCLDTYGMDLSEFIETFEPAMPLTYLADIARLDWAISACEHAIDDIPLKAEDLQNCLETENFSLNMRTSSYLVTSKFPILTLRNYALDPNNEEKPPPILKNNAESVLVYRPQLKAEIILLSNAEFVILDNLYRNISLIDSVEQTLQTYQEFNFNHFLQKFISLEIFRKPYTDP